MDEGLAAHMPTVRFGECRDGQAGHPARYANRQGNVRSTRPLPVGQPRLGDVPLFPAPGDGTKPIRRDLAARWLLRAEALAELPKLVGGVWHPYRRLWATERKHHADVDVQLRADGRT